MVVLKIIGWIFAGLLLLLLGISLLPVDLLLQSDGVQGFRVRVRILGIAFGGGEKKPKKKKPESALVKALKKSLGLSHLGNADTVRSTVKTHGFSMTLKDTVETFLLLLDRVLWILKHCKIPYCRITAVSAGEDAALDYGIACATLYPLAGYLQERMGMNPKKLKMDIRCDYGLPEGKFELDLAVRIRVYHALSALVHIIMKNIEKDLNEVS